MMGEVRGWTKRADGTLFISFEIIDEHPELTRELPGSTWVLERVPSRSVARRRIIQAGGGRRRST